LVHFESLGIEYSGIFHIHFGVFYGHAEFLWTFWYFFPFYCTVYLPRKIWQPWFLVGFVEFHRQKRVEQEDPSFFPSNLELAKIRPNDFSTFSIS
jgi:hypothetical protein